MTNLCRVFVKAVRIINMKQQTFDYIMDFIVLAIAIGGCSIFAYLLGAFRWGLV